MKGWWGIGRMIMLLVAGALMLASLSYPMWSIYLWSFSYPDGIGMSVYQNRPGDPVDVDQLDGGVNELQVLNHFIGMKPITKDLLIFKILPKATVLMGVLFIVAAFWRKRKFLYGVAGAGVLLGIYGMGSFFYYMYQYGHDLDPNAAITIEPFMPGIIGEKNLAQFTSWSQFENGTYFLILSTMLVLIVAGVEWWMARKQRKGEAQAA